MSNNGMVSVPLELLKNIEMTWRQASGFSNKANDVIEEGLGQLRDLLAAPVVERQEPTAAKTERVQVAEIVEFGFGLKEISWVGGKMPEVGTKLYICPELPSILDLSYEEAQKVECELPPRRLPNGHTLGGLHFPASTPAPGEPILVEAVAVTRECEEDGLRLDWLLEGGIAALELPGTVLLVAHGTITNDSGNGYVYPARNPEDDE